MEATFVREVFARYRGGRRKRTRISNASNVRDFVSRTLKDNTREHLIALYLDGGHAVVAFAVVSVGTAQGTAANPREVFQLAILAGACAIVLSHNHPSGKPEPSTEDNAITKRFSEAGRLLGIPLLDHVIVTDSGYTSFAETGEL
jgi:DNA repair protein RadC